MCKFSIIIPVYNQSNNILNCLSQIQKQSYNDYEVICVDDGSVDDSAQIIKMFTAMDSRYKYIWQRNSGAGTARNLGIQSAKGEFVLFLDADDMYPTTQVLDSLSKAIDHSNRLVVGGSLTLKKRGKIKAADRNFTFYKPGFVSTNEFTSSAFYQRFAYSRVFLLNNGLEFPSYRRGQDAPFFLRVLISSGGAYCINNPTYTYSVGHQELHFLPEQLIGQLDGAKDLLRLSKDNSLWNIHRSVIPSIYWDLSLYKGFQSHDTAVRIIHLLEDVYREIAWSNINMSPREDFLEYCRQKALTNSIQISYKSLETRVRLVIRNMRCIIM